MGLFKEAFRPALNKEGFALLTFMGVNKGVRNDNGNEFIKLEFKCKGVVRGETEDMAILCDGSYEVTNTLGVALSNMGYVPPVASTSKKQVEDEDGFLVDDVDEDEEGFEIASEAILNIEQFLTDCEGKKYLANVSKPVDRDRKTPYWRIDENSLKLYVKVASNA